MNTDFALSVDLGVICGDILPSSQTPMVPHKQPIWITIQVDDGDLINLDHSVSKKSRK